jgi:hypothetical protein
LTELQDRLKRLYGEEKVEIPESKSWVPKRPFRNDPWERLKRQIEEHQYRQEKVTYDEATLTKIKEELFRQVEEFLKSEYGDKRLEEKIDHFSTSWNKMYEKYGNLLIVALEELSHEMRFVNHEGYIDKQAIKTGVKKVKRSNK